MGRGGGSARRHFNRRGGWHSEGQRCWNGCSRWRRRRLQLRWKLRDVWQSCPRVSRRGAREVRNTESGRPNDRHTLILALLVLDCKPYDNVCDGVLACGGASGTRVQGTLPVPCTKADECFLELRRKSSCWTTVRAEVVRWYAVWKEQDGCACGKRKRRTKREIICWTHYRMDYKPSTGMRMNRGR